MFKIDLYFDILMAASHTHFIIIHFHTRILLFLDKQQVMLQYVNMEVFYTNNN